jgi:hypothetical protein
MIQVFWISYKDLLRNYQHIDRTRLFGPEWTVTQHWTSLEVPWSVDYLDTKFRVTIPSAGPVVIVLSQLDDRYFRGLEGQYDFHLQFRLHKDDEDEYIVRSNAAYYMKRSVSTELDLEPGVYWVLLKITAKRYPESPTVADVITKTCQSRRGKLLSVGLSYDMAHAKGDFAEIEVEKEKEEKQEKRDKKKDFAKKMHAARAKERKKAKLRGIRRDTKKHEKMMRLMAEEAEKRAREEAAQEAARKMEEEMKLTDSASTVGVNGLTESSPKPDAFPIFQTPSFTNGFNNRRRDTLSVQPPSRHATYPSISTPDIRVQRASLGAGGKLTLNDISDDELSWDSDLDAPSDISDTEMMAPSEGACGSCGRQNGGDEEEDEFERDPWNAVCVVGLRVYSKGQEVQIEVVRGDEYGDEEVDGEGEVASPVVGRKRLDVDDAAKDAVEAVSPVSPSVIRGFSMQSLESMVLQ